MDATCHQWNTSVTHLWPAHVVRQKPCPTAYVPDYTILELLIILGLGSETHIFEPLVSKSAVQLGSEVTINSTILRGHLLCSHLPFAFPEWPTYYCTFCLLLIMYMEDDYSSRIRDWFFTCRAVNRISGIQLCKRGFYLASPFLTELCEVPLVSFQTSLIFCLFMCSSLILTNDFHGVPPK